MAIDDLSVETLCAHARAGASVALTGPRDHLELLQLAACFAEATKGALLLLRNSELCADDRAQLLELGGGKVLFE